MTLGTQRQSTEGTTDPNTVWHLTKQNNTVEYFATLPILWPTLSHGYEHQSWCNCETVSLRVTDAELLTLHIQGSFRGNTTASLSSPLPYMSVTTWKKSGVCDLLFPSHLPFTPPRPSQCQLCVCLPLHSLHPHLPSSLSSLIPPPQCTLHILPLTLYPLPLVNM